MPNPFHIIVCGSIVPNPLQTLEPINTPQGPSLKNEMMLPAVLDPWAGHALYEAANLVKQHPGSKIWLVSLAPKAKLQQVMMNIAQKVAFELVAVDGPATGFSDAAPVASELANAIQGIQGLDRSRMMLFGGWESASRGSGAVMQMLAEILGISEQFQGVDALAVQGEDCFEIKERVEGGQYQVSQCSGLPILVGWATGNLPEPKNNPQIGMVNMKTVMPALQKAVPSSVKVNPSVFQGVELPKQKRETRVEKNMSPGEIAEEILAWLKQ